MPGADAALLNQAGLGRSLGLPSASQCGRHVWNQYVIRVPGGQRDALREHAHALGSRHRNLLSRATSPATVLRRAWAMPRGVCPSRNAPPWKQLPCRFFRNSPPTNSNSSSSELPNSCSRQTTHRPNPTCRPAPHRRRQHARPGLTIEHGPLGRTPPAGVARGNLLFV